MFVLKNIAILEKDQFITEISYIIGIAAIADVSTGLITVLVRGTANVNIEWFASVQLTENKLTSVT